MQGFALATVYLLATLAGLAAGVLTGVLPGLHINLVAVMAASLVSASAAGAALPGPVSLLAVAAFILAMSISHVFHDFLPTIFLGVSESESALAVMPGHRLLLRGLGRKAIMLAAFGALSGVMAIIALTPLLVAAIKPVFAFVSSYIWLVLIIIAAFQISRARSIKAAAANTFIFCLSGVFGLAVFNMPNLSQPLLPMFSGLFGLSSLAGGLLKQSSIPEQESKAEIRVVKKRHVAKYVAVGLLSSSFMGLFPALGPAQASMLGTGVLRKTRAEAYIFLLGVISSASMLFALLTLYAFGKARNGSIAVIGSILNTANAFPANTLILLIAVAFVAAALSCISTLALSGMFAVMMRKISYRLLSLLVMVFVIFIVAAFSGLTGLLVLAVATAIGLSALLAKSSRQLLMGCLMVPVIGYYVIA